MLQNTCDGIKFTKATQLKNVKIQIQISNVYLFSNKSLRQAIARAFLKITGVLVAAHSSVRAIARQMPVTIPTRVVCRCIAVLKLLQKS
jgi:hypothetical protein